MLHRRQLGERRQRRDARGRQSCHRTKTGFDSPHGRRRNAPRDCGRRRCAAGMESAHRQRARRCNAALVRPDDRTSRRPCHAHDRRTGQAAGGVAKRNPLRRLVHRVVRGGSQAPVRRHHSGSPGRQANPGAAPTGGRGRGHHAVELSRRNDHPQGRTRACRRLHVGVQAGHADALFGAGAGGTRGSSGCAEGCIQHDHGRRRGDRRRR